MSEFSASIRKEIEEQDFKKQKSKAEQSVKTNEPKKAANHLRNASEHLDSLAELTDLPSPKQKYKEQAEHFRDVASKLESQGISAVAETESSGQTKSSDEADGEEFGISDEGPNVDVTTPDITFRDVGGMSDLKQTLLEKVADPVRRKEMYKQYDIDPIKGVLFQGPPGTGKTHITRSLAGELGWNFIELSPADVTSALVGEGAKNIKDIFQTAKEHQPCLLFFDEIDSIAVNRSGSTQGTQSEQMMLTQLLTEMNKLDDEDVIVIGATNAPEEVDKALLNATRFSEVIEVPLPDTEARKAVLRVHLRDRPILQEDINFKRVAERTEGFSGADMEAVAADAARNALNEAEKSGSIVPIQQTHIEEAIQERHRSKDDSRKGGYLQGDDQ